MQPISLRYGKFAIIALFAICASPAHAQFGTNLLVNGDAEAGVGSATGGSVPVPGWAVSGNFTAVQYDIGGGFVASSDPGPALRGANYFAGGENNGFSSASQSLSLGSVAAEIDAGTVGFDASGFFGGFATQTDFSLLRLTFFDSSNVSLGNVTVGSVSAADRGGATGLLFRQLTGTVPVGARSITANLEMTRTAGSYNDGYADNLSVELVNNAVTVPEAGVMPFLLLGIPVLTGFVARRQCLRA